mgnify:CR=1 FL=1
MSDILFPYDSNDYSLTDKEKEVRDIMLYAFNPALKTVLNIYNPDEFLKFGYNSCRQTAIFGAYFLKTLFPDYEIRAWEGDFVEPVNGVATPYVHAFIIAKKDNRRLLIDLSRTTKRLLFHPLFGNIYPDSLDYKDVSFVGMSTMDYVKLVEDNKNEYLTHMPSVYLFDTIKSLTNNLLNLPDKERKLFWKAAYENFTGLLEITN